jgi:ATP-dependent Clp protease ATP-binding subunit ClpB
MAGVRTLDPTRRSQKADTLIAKFEKRIVGQQAAKDALISTVESCQSGMYDKTKPIRSLLFLGPTGSGKTGTAEAFAEGVMGSSDKMLKVSCGEFQHSHEIAKLVGSPPGYLGHRETHPFFTNQSLMLARTGPDGKEVMPFTIVLWDEVEKASDALWALLLGILDKGELTTGTNDTVDFRPTIHIMTSNVGVSEMNDDSAIGFNAGDKSVDDSKLESIAMAAARKKFMPEFLNRLDSIVMFKTLTGEDLKEIRAQLLEKVQERIIYGSNILFEMRVSDFGLKKILDDGYDRRYNARHLKRTIEKYVAEPLTRLVATGQIDDGDIVVADYSVDWDQWKYMASKRDYANEEKSGRTNYRLVTCS